jgi:flagellin
MSLSILNNISSLMAQNQLSVNQASLQTALTQLSTGKRINSGADDPAGLSISNGLQANVTALTQSCLNAADGIGLLQTADGALSQVTSQLNRAITLATQASTGGLDTNESSALNNEYQSILNSINDIGSSTTYNGSQIFTNNAMTPFLSDGTSGNTLSAMSVGTLSTSGLDLGAGGSINATSASSTLTLTSNLAAGSTVTIGSQQYTFVSGAAGSGQVSLGGSAQATLTNLANAVNGDGNNTANASATASASGSVITFTAKATGAAGNGVTTAGTLNAASGPTGTWSSPGDLSGGANVTTAQEQLFADQPPADGDEVSVGGTTYKFVNSLSENGGAADQVLINSGYGSMQDLEDAVNGGSGSGAGTNYTAGTTPNANVTAFGLAHGVGYPNSQGYLQFQADTPGAAGNSELGALTTTGNSLSFNYSWTGVNEASASDTLTMSTVPQNGNTVSVGGQTYTFTSGTPTSGQVAIGSDVPSTLLNLSNAVSGDSHNTANASVTSIAYEGSTDYITFTAKTAGSGGNSIPASSNLTTGGGGSTGSWSSGSLANGVNASTSTGTDLSNTTDAQAALLSITNAISTVAGMRASIGSNINALQSATSVMTTQSQNLTSAESNITDANMAQAVANMTQGNILMSTSMAALQQANQQAQAILKLLQ